MTLLPPLTRKPKKGKPQKSSRTLAKSVREPVRKSSRTPNSKLQQPRPTIAQPKRPRRGGTDPGPRNAPLDAQNPDLFIPPKTDAGILPNLRFSFADAHMRLERGGWTREITVRELPISTNMAGVDMRLNAGAIREMHWHKEAEWAYMLYGNARVSIVDELGRFFIGDVGVGDLWYFPPGLPHSIQGLGPDGCEFLLVFDDGSFSEDNTFLLSDWIKHTPNEVLAKNFGVPAKSFARVPEPDQLYIFAGKVPPPLARDRDRKGITPTPLPYIHRMLAQKPIRTRSGAVRITDSKNFPVATAISAALVEVEPAACAKCTGTRTQTSGSTISRARRAWACSAPPATRAPSTIAPATSAMFRSPWGTTWRTRAMVRCASSRCSRARAMPTCRSTSGWR